MGMLDVANGRQVYFEHHEGAGPTIVFAHGWGMHCRAWDPVVAAVRKEGYGAVVFDQRGCGRSDKDFTEISITSSADDLVRIVEHLGLEAVVLNGWSIGGAICVYAAEKLASRCKGVISTVGATPKLIRGNGWDHGQEPGAAIAMCALLETDRAARLASFEAEMFVDGFDPAIQRWAGRMLFDCAFTADAALLDLETMDQRSILERLDVPFLAIAGVHDTLVPPEVVIAAGELAPKGQVVLFKNSSHTPFLEERELYLETLLSFIRSLD